MKYYSLNGQSPLVSFKDATIHGLAPDKGLYFPTAIPNVTSLINNIDNIPDEEIAFRVIAPYVDGTINDDRLYQIVSETINFSIPVIQISNDVFCLELFHGPTMAFKDIGARFMSRCLSEFVKDGAAGNKKMIVLVATSGDTGGAVAHGFYNQDGIDVVILYPSGKVSPVQEMQLTGMGKNIYAVEVKGSFDDCQAMVKQAFADKELNDQLFLTSANSINVARWLPQQFYYFLAYKQWQEKDRPPVISVPSGNFGNICAGMLAYCSGLPVEHFVAACNMNDAAAQYMSTGTYKPVAVKHTYSNAMDVGDPSNFSRLLQLFNGDHTAIEKMLTAFTITDEETVNAIRNVSEQNNYILDPHGAVGYLALKKYLSAHPDNKGIFLETAHPVKFPSVVEQATGKKIEIPVILRSLLQQEKKATIAEPDFRFLKEYLTAKAAW